MRPEFLETTGQSFRNQQVLHADTFRHIVTLFREELAKNVSFVFWPSLPTGYYNVESHWAKFPYDRASE
jgi:hypothetical protein